MSDKSSSHLEREQQRWFIYLVSLATLDEATPPEKLEEVLSKADSALEELLEWGLPLAPHLPDYPDEAGCDDALKIVFGRAREGFEEFQMALRICMSIRLKNSKPAGKRGGASSGSAEVSAQPLSEEAFENLPRVFELIQAHQRLRAIVNTQQRESLLRALARSAEIDDGAWEPVPQGWPSGKLGAELSEATRSSASRLQTDFDASYAFKLVSQHQLEQLAIRAEKSAKASTKFLCPPIDAPGLSESAFEARSLIGWAFFNPFGPSECQLSLEFVPGRDVYLLVLWSTHPFTPESVILGALPSSVARDKSGLLEILTTLFGQYGKHGLFLDHLPSYPVFFEDQSVLTPQEIGELLLKRLSRSDIEEQLRNEVEGFLRFPCQPWARFRAEWRQRGSDEGLAGIMADMVSSRIGGFLDMACADEQAHLGKKPPGRAAVLGKRRVSLADWWAIVSDGPHIEAYRRAMMPAWRLSQALMSRD